jgi:hypothetical protein
MILTSCRIICLNKSSSAFRAFDLPLSLISEEGFAQPIFGANYLHGKCRPLLNSLPGMINFKIWLMTGGCGTLAPAYLRMVKSCRANSGRGVQQSVINAYQGPTTNSAYIDPNDPSIIYLQQPAVAQNINYNPWGYQPVPQSQPMQYQQNPNYQPVPPQQPGYQPIPPQQPNYNPIPPQKPGYQPIPPQQPGYQPVPPQQPNYQPIPPQQPNYQPVPPHQPVPPQQPNYNNNMPANNYPNFDQYNQQNQNALPTEQEIYNSQNRNNQQPMYPNQGMGGLNNVINDQQQQNGGKYFGFWGPSLDRNQNNNNNNGYGQ